MVHAAVGGAPDSNGEREELGRGGDMTAMHSTNDPMFWLHHSFLDGLWQTWMDTKGDALQGAALFAGSARRQRNATARDELDQFEGLRVRDVLNLRDWCVQYPQPWTVFLPNTGDQSGRAGRRQRGRGRNDTNLIQLFKATEKSRDDSWKQAASRVPLSWTKTHAQCYINAVGLDAREQVAILEEAREAEERLLRLQARIHGIPESDLEGDNLERSSQSLWEEVSVEETEDDKEHHDHQNHELKDRREESGKKTERATNEETKVNDDKVTEQKHQGDDADFFAPQQYQDSNGNDGKQSSKWTLIWLFSGFLLTVI